MGRQKCALQHSRVYYFSALPPFCTHISSGTLATVYISCSHTKILLVTGDALTRLDANLRPLDTHTHTHTHTQARARTHPNKKIDSEATPSEHDKQTFLSKSRKKFLITLMPILNMHAPFAVCMDMKGALPAISHTHTHT